MKKKENIPGAWDASASQALVLPWSHGVVLVVAVGRCWAVGGLRWAKNYGYEVWKCFKFVSNSESHDFFDQLLLSLIAQRPSPKTTLCTTITPGARDATHLEPLAFFPPTQLDNYLQIIWMQQAQEHEPENWMTDFTQYPQLCDEHATTITTNPPSRRQPPSIAGGEFIFIFFMEVSYIFIFRYFIHI